MRKLNTITTAVLSAVMIAVLGSGSAMAAEARDTTDTDPESVVSFEDKMARLKRNNPHLTEEQWERVERVEDPESHGLILVSEEQRVEDGQLIIDSYYMDAVSPLVSGRREYSAYTRIFSTGSDTGELIATIYMNATFEYNDGRIDRYVRVTNIDGFAVNQTTGAYPVEAPGSKYPDYPKGDEINGYVSTITGDMINDAKLKIWLNYGNGDLRGYDTYITVNERGEQISTIIRDRLP